MGPGSTFTVLMPFGRRICLWSMSARPAPWRRRQTARAFVQEALRWLPIRRRANLRTRSPAKRSQRIRITAPRRLDQGTAVARIVSRTTMPICARTCVSCSNRLPGGSWPNGARPWMRRAGPCPTLLLSDVMMPGHGRFCPVASGARRAGAAENFRSSCCRPAAGRKRVIEGLEADGGRLSGEAVSARELLARVSGQLTLARLRRGAAAMEEALRRQAEVLLNQAPLGHLRRRCGQAHRRSESDCAPDVRGVAPLTGQQFAEVMRRLWPRAGRRRDNCGSSVIPSTQVSPVSSRARAAADRGDRPPNITSGR